jgi:hypothetical protein
MWSREGLDQVIQEEPLHRPKKVRLTSARPSIRNATIGRISPTAYERKERISMRKL